MRYLLLVTFLAATACAVSQREKLSTQEGILVGRSLYEAALRDDRDAILRGCQRLSVINDPADHDLFVDPCNAVITDNNIAAARDGFRHALPAKDATEIRERVRIDVVGAATASALQTRVVGEVESYFATQTATP